MKVGAWQGFKSPASPAPFVDARVREETVEVWASSVEDVDVGAAEGWFGRAVGVV